MKADLVEEVIELYGLDDVRTLGYCYRFSIILSVAEHYEDALQLGMHLYSRCTKLLGHFHEDTMDIKDGIIIDLVNLDKRDIAMKVAGEEYLQRIEHLGANHEATLYSMQQYLDLRDHRW